MNKHNHLIEMRGESTCFMDVIKIEANYHIFCRNYICKKFLNGKSLLCPPALANGSECVVTKCISTVNGCCVSDSTFRSKNIEHRCMGV